MYIKVGIAYMELNDLVKSKTIFLELISKN